jgi:hypothetical protein
MSEELNLKLKEAIEINAKNGAKQKISPVGNAIGFDGRAYLISGDTLTQNATQRGVKIPLLVDHGYSEHGGKAAGWINPNALEVREDGLYAEIEKNALGEELIGGKAYLYYSPAYRCDRVENTLIVRELIEVSLTNTPNLAMPEANKTQEQEVETQTAQQGAQGESPTELEANRQKLTDVKAQLNVVKDELKKIIEANKTLKVDLAIERLKILPKDREFALSLNDEQLEAYIRRSDNSEQLGKLTKSANPAPIASDRAERFVRLAINPKNKGVK